MKISGIFRNVEIMSKINKQDLFPGPLALKDLLSVIFKKVNFLKN